MSFMDGVMVGTFCGVVMRFWPSTFTKAFYS